MKKRISKKKRYKD